jgi:CheY-like chemotaxis protein
LLALLEAGAARDVILLDLRMPVMRGWHLIRTLDTEPDLAGISVVAVTALGSQVPDRVTNVLRKPFHARPAGRLRRRGEHDSRSRLRYSNMLPPF